MVRCQYGHKKMKQDNCPRLSQSQITAPCPLIHLSIMYEVAHKHSASKLAHAFSGGLQCVTTSLNPNQHFQAKSSDLTMTNGLIHGQITN